MSSDVTSSATSQPEQQTKSSSESKLSSTSSSSLAALARQSTHTPNLSDLILATDTTSSPMTQSIGSTGGGGGMALNEKVATLASSIYTELEKVIKAHGRDTVKDLMSLVVNVLEALDTAYHEKEELSVDNELLKDDYEKLLSQYEREKQHRKDSELKLFQSEDSFAEQKKEYEEKIKSLESIVRMIDLKSKNTSDHVMRLEEKENELKREYNKLHERYTELFKTHCDYMERTKLLFGYDQRLESNSNSHRGKSKSGSHHSQSTGNQASQSNQNSSQQSIEANIKQLLEMLKNSPHVSINKSELVNALRNLGQQKSGIVDINSLISVIIAAAQQPEDSGSANSLNNLGPNASTASLTSLVSNGQSGGNQSIKTQQSNETNSEINVPASTGVLDVNPDEQLLVDPADIYKPVEYLENCLGTDDNRLNLHTENFDEHLSNTEFEENIPDATNSNKISTDLDAEYEGEYDGLVKNDLSLFNELSKENYDVTELDDGADLTGMTREVANLIRENSELLQTKHALNVLKDDLIVRLDQFSNEMVILREEIRSLQTVKACLQLRITELEEEARKAKEELSIKSKKAEEEDETLPISQRKRFTRAEMARVLMERNQYKERLMDLQEAVRWTEMIRASKAAADQTGASNLASTLSNQPASSISDDQASSHHHEHHKKRSALWKFFSDLFGTSSSHANTNQAVVNTSPIAAAPQPPTTVRSPTSAQILSPKSRRTNPGVARSESEQQIVSKAFEFLKEGDQKHLIDKRELEAVREDGRMQAYGWSLPYKNRESSAKEPVLNISVPVPVYCRPLFQKDVLTQLKLSCASTINYLFDKTCALDSTHSPMTDLARNHSSCFESVDPITQLPTFKSSHVWICNFNETDTHVSILDANRPSDLIKQFTLADVRIHCILSVGGAVRADLDADSKNEIKLKQQSGEPAQHDIDSITYIEFEPAKEAVEAEKKIVSTLYPTMWLGSQEGTLLVHSSIKDVEVTLEKVKLKDAILCMWGKVIVGLADGSAAVFTRNKSTGEWDLRSYYLITFDSSHHSVRCLINVNQMANIWCGCRNKIYVLNSSDLTISTVIEVHPRKENQVRHLAHFNDGVWVSIRLDSTLRLYHSKTFQQLQYLDIEPFITRMLGTSNLGLSLVRVSSLIIASKRLWIGTGNGVILSIPFNDETSVKNSTNGKKPGGVVRVNSRGEENTSDVAPYCNISDAQFSFHGHRDSVRFFLNVPNLTIQKSPVTPSGPSPAKPGPGVYEKAETLLVLSGGHGYIDFRIGDTTALGKKSTIDSEDVKLATNEAGDDNSSLKKNDRAYLIVWQINNE